MRSILLPLLFCACTPQPTETGAAFQPTEGTAPGILKTFGDWTVGCDNVALCTMMSLAPGKGHGDVTMTLLRQPGPGGAYDLSFETRGGKPVTLQAAAIDGKPTPLPILNGVPAASVAAAMATGRSLALIERGRVRAQLSLAGASAALRWIDVQQGRAGTRSAAVAKGASPPTAVPAIGNVPTIRAVRPLGAAAGLGTRQAAALGLRAQCDTNSAVAGLPASAHALGEGATLVVVPCRSSTDGLASALFVLREGSAQPARLDVGPAENTRVANAAWRDGVLTAFARGRGIGGCGVRRQFVWDGERLRLSDQAECRGGHGLITTWRTQVVRR